MLCGGCTECNDSYGKHMKKKYQYLIIISISNLVPYVLGRSIQNMVGKIESSTYKYLLTNRIWGGLGTGIRSVSFEMRPRQRFYVFNVKWRIFPLIFGGFQKVSCLDLISVAQEVDRDYILGKIEF